eukprot:7134690-Pyramimonas_sp.AAC.1
MAWSLFGRISEASRRPLGASWGPRGGPGGFFLGLFGGPLGASCSLRWAFRGPLLGKLSGHHWGPWGALSGPDEIDKCRGNQFASPL